GYLHLHIQRWQSLAKLGTDVEIRDFCISGCTMIMSYVPKERICFGENAALGFHLARDAKTGRMALDTSLWMLHTYPRPIYDWLMARGGVASMTIQDMWILDAPELWAMGYRKCPPEPIDDSPPVPMTILKVS